MGRSRATATSARRPASYAVDATTGLVPAAAGPPSGVYPRLVKPALDRVVALLALVLLSPLLAAVALCVLLGLGRPVLYRQVRVGLDGRPFHILKFCTMRRDRRERREPFGHPDRRDGYHKRDDDPRHTAVGRVLRRSSLDELPQLVNIVLGDMSLVGPRPELPHVVEHYEAWQHRRHLVRPGLTGPWQTAARGDGPMHEHLHLDLDYVARVSLAYDLGLLARTAPALLRRPGR